MQDICWNWVKKEILGTVSWPAGYLANPEDELCEAEQTSKGGPSWGSGEGLLEDTEIPHSRSPSRRALGREILI